MKKLIIGTLAVLGLAACAGPKQYESQPVLVETAYGTVTCQLYTLGQVTWDRSIARPAGLTVVAANEICVEEGQRVADGGTPVYASAMQADIAL